MKKILIIAGGLQFGGAERFAANIIEYAPEGEFSFDYLIFEGLGDAFAPGIEAKGGRILSMPSPSTGYVAYMKRLGQLMDENHYDAVHSQTQFNSGINLWVAKRHGVPIRIAHSHTTAHEHKISRVRQLYEDVMRRMIRRNATHCCACGVQAGEWMYGKHPFTVIRNGIDADRFAFAEEKRKEIRQQYHISGDCFVIGHSGTLSALKNQEFLIRLLPKIQKIKPNAVLMLLGTGKDEIKAKLLSAAEECGAAASVIFTGAVMNVSEYLSAFDVFAFPSLREGTPLALLEAQTNGLPCVISDVIPSDAQVTDLVTALGLYDTDAWNSAIVMSRRSRPEQYAEQFRAIGWDIRTANEALYNIYRGARS